MNKGIKLIKRAVALVLVLLFSINTFAALVGDNDGAAFITKAEFDSMKTNFQSQLDRYNSSINNKIDGAIAAYLAGITIAKTTTTPFIGFSKDGVISIVDHNTLPWIDGLMTVSGSLVVGRYFSKYASSYGNGYDNIGDITIEFERLPMLISNAFRETAINNISTTNWTASWYGYTQTCYNIHLNVYTSADSGWANSYFTNKRFFLNPSDGSGIWSSTKSEYLTLDRLDDGMPGHSGEYYFNAMRWAFSDNQTVAYKNGMYIYQKMLSLQRQQMNPATNKYIIVTKPNLTYNYFVNYDGFYDWCNDSTDTFSHKTLDTCFEQMLSVSSFKAIVRSKKSDGSASGTLVKDVEWSPSISTDTDIQKHIDFAVGNVMNNINVFRKRAPYIGYTSGYINNFNKIYSSIYDSHMNSILKLHPSATYLLDDANEKHLPVVAGLPVCQVEREASVTIPLEFVDNTVAHYVWIKNEPFSLDVAPQNDASCMTEFKSIKNGSINNTLHCIKIEAGQKCEIKTTPAENEGYIFLKWSYTDNSCAGGGTFKTPESVVLEK